MGASAGGIEAFQAFFKAMPADSGMAFVLVQHLDPEHASALPEIIGASTTMPVAQAKTGDVLAQNRVFVIPPDSVLTVAGGTLRVARGASTPARRASIDAFLISLAEDQGENAIGIILAGFGSDGARGVEAIREHGGLTLTQAEFDHHPKTGMPQSAAASGCVDHVLPIEKMPAALLEHQTYRAKTDGEKGPDGVRKDVGDHLGAICAVLNSRLGRDFSQYKTSTLMRRIQRRMQVLQAESVTAYLEELRQRSDEPELLFREVLIRVTRFFRDPAAFEALAARIPALLARNDGQDLRIWVPGCATGEEAYTLAILCKEAMAHADRPRKVQIFATDIDDQAVEIARIGIYAAASAADLPGPLLDRYFQKENDSYRVSKDIREMCLFSTHDLVKDPPFSRLSLISCRNLMIYFGPALQKRIVAMFHYGLRSGGLLFLGSSEAVTAHAGLFLAADKKNRIFERRDAPTQLPSLSASAPPPARVNAARETREGELDPEVARVMSRYMPAFVVIDRRQNVQQFSGQIGKYLAPSDGAMSMNLAVLAHAELRTPLRAALKRVIATQRRVVNAGIVLDIAGRPEAVTLAVEPLEGRKGSAAEGLIVVAFQDLGPVQVVERGGSSDGDNQPSAEELAGVRERLQTLTEELETSNEELQSSNEEYQSVNEELQSTNEELETSKEELQSINEELATLNAELNARNENLVDLNSDLSNLIDSTSIATLFLDQDLRIRRFTPAVLDIFSVREGDQGRPISDIVSRLDEDGLNRDAAQVLRTLIPVHRAVGLATGNRTFQMEIRPYRGQNNTISGVVITFVDITDRERAEKSRASLAAIIDSSEDAIIGHDLDGSITSWNASAEKLFGYVEQEAIGQPISFIVPLGRPEDEPELMERVRRGERIEHYETLRLRKNASLVEVSQSLSPVRNSSGTIIGAARIIRDITTRRQGDRERSLLLGELDHRVKNILATVSSIVTQTLKADDTPANFATSLQGRIKALTRAHNLLTRGGDIGGALEIILQTELAPYIDTADRVTIEGPRVTLTPKAGLSLAMAVHELATNAAKYGALSVPEGRLSISWQSVTDTERQSLRIVWQEKGGPRVSPPSKRGFGTTLIERALAYEFEAKVDRTFALGGLTCVFQLPLTREIGYVGDNQVASEDG
jgi:two-component system CheB/CheR fusion protein